MTALLGLDDDPVGGLSTTIGEGKVFDRHFD